MINILIMLLILVVPGVQIIPENMPIVFKTAAGEDFEFVSKKQFINLYGPITQAEMNEYSVKGYFTVNENRFLPIAKKD